MFCENCGADLQDPNQSYCPNCGIPLNIKIFKYSDQKKNFEAGKVIKHPYEMLDPEFVLLFVDSKRLRVWIWHGSNTTTRMKFVADKLALDIRDRYGIGFKIVAIDEGNEPLEFKRMIGLEEEKEITGEESVPPYTAEELGLFETLTREKKQLLLEKTEEKGISSPQKRHKKDLKHNLYCKFCGSKLTKRQKICPVCGKTVI